MWFCKSVPGGVLLGHAALRGEDQFCRYTFNKKICHINPFVCNLKPSSDFGVVLQSVPGVVVHSVPGGEPSALSLRRHIRSGQIPTWRGSEAP